MATLSLSKEAKERRQAKLDDQKKQPKLSPKEKRKAENLAAEERKRARVQKYREEAADWLAINFPGLFTFPPRPFEIGITKKIIAEAPKEIVPAGIKYCIVLWCSSDAYIQVRDAGNRRITLDEAR